MQDGHAKRWKLEVTLACLAAAGFMWGIYQHYDDRRSSLSITSGVSPKTNGFRNNIFEDHDKYKMEYLVVEVTNAGRAASHDLHLRVESAAGSWIVGMNGDPEWRVAEEASKTRESPTVFHYLSGEPRLLKASYDKLSPGLKLTVVVAYAHMTGQVVTKPEVLVFDDDGVGH